MAHVVNDGLGLVQTTGQKVRDGVGAVASGVRDEVGVVTNGVREEIGGIRQHAEHPAAHKRKQSAGTARLVGLAASAAGVLAVFGVGRLVRTKPRRHGE